MTDGFSFKVAYQCMTCEDCPDFVEETTDWSVIRHCLHESGPRSDTFKGVWVNDEIHPDCPHRKAK
jgi:hypothetical protein